MKSFKGVGQAILPTLQVDHTTALQNTDKVLMGARTRVCKEHEMASS